VKLEYREGPEALENFKRGMEALFKVPKTAELQKRSRPVSLLLSQTEAFRQGLEGDLCRNVSPTFLLAY
jgi:hypothetical protein